MITTEHIAIISVILNFIVVPIVGGFWYSSNRVKNELDEFKLYVAREYLTALAVEKQFGKIDRQLSKIWQKLNNE